MNSILKMLLEDEEKSPNMIVKNEKDSPRLASDSADDQIDSYLISFEERAIQASDDEDVLFESLREKSLRFLFEQDEVEEVPAEGDADSADSPEGAADESAVEPPSGSEDVEAEESLTPKMPSMDVDKFAKSVVRLAKNANKLLDLEEVIINRAKNYLEKEYNDTYVAKFKETLEEQFGYSLEEFEREAASEDTFGVGANPAGAGMSGGG
jgi:hypothetical protein